VTRNGAPAGDERLTIKGEFAMAASVPALDPVANGFTIKLIDRATATTILSRIVPPGAGSPGWSGAAPRWKFSDRDQQTSAAGITKALVKDRSSRTPGLVLFRIKGKDADFQVATDNLELMVIAGGATQGTAGQCGRVQFAPGGAGTPACLFSSGNTVLRCD
jgi:hypothetical protein